MEYAYSKTGNVISKSAKIKGAKYIVNKGHSFIGNEVEIHGDRNNGKPIISWGTHVVLQPQCSISPGTKNNQFYPLLIGDNVYIGENSIIEAARIGSNVIIHENCEIANMTVIKDCTIILPGTKTKPFSILGPGRAINNSSSSELPASAPLSIKFFCEMAYNGTPVPPPEPS